MTDSGNSRRLTMQS